MIDNKKDVLYTQCGLRKNNVFQVSWIPTKFAKVGQILKLKDDNEVWNNGWVVEWTGTTDLHVEDSRKAIREHRKRTGDSLPKIKDEENGDVVALRKMRKSGR